MTPTTAIVVIAALAVLLAIVWMITRAQRSKTLRSHFGPEYDHLVHEKGDPRRAEAELADRERRVRKLSIHPLPHDAIERYARQWNDQQARFVDEPKAAVVEADHLVEAVMKDRGYPVGEFDQRAADISVDHPHVVENYRAAHEITLREQRGLATTDDLRNAMIYYRDLFRELLEDPAPLRGTSR